MMEIRVETIMLGTRDLGGARVIVISNQRQDVRGPERMAHTIRRWIARQWPKFDAEWMPIGSPMISMGDPGDLWIRNQSALRIDQRAIRRDEHIASYLADSGGLQLTGDGVVAITARG